MRVLCTLGLLGLTLAALPARAQPTFAGAATPTHPITQPSFVQPGTAAVQPLTPLPPGSYVLTITLYPEGVPGQPAPPPTTDVMPVAVTNNGGAVAATSAGPVYSGSIDASGHLHLSGQVRGRGADLDGPASGRHAQGTVLRPLTHGLEHGKFDLQPASAP